MGFVLLQVLRIISTRNLRRKTHFFVFLFEWRCFYDDSGRMIGFYQHSSRVFGFFNKRIYYDYYLCLVASNKQQIQWSRILSRCVFFQTRSVYRNEKCEDSPKLASDLVPGDGKIDMLCNNNKVSFVILVHYILLCSHTDRFSDIV